MRKIICALFLLLCACGDKPKIQGQEFHTLFQGIEISLGFGTHDNRYYGKAVNSYYGTYRVAGDRIYFSAPASTMYFADSDDLNAEAAYLDTLPHIQSYQIDKTTLTLLTDDHQHLIFQK